MNEFEKSNKIKVGPVFLRNNLEETVLRITTDYRFFVRFPGEKEYKVDSSTKMATNAFLEWDEITESEYNEF